MTREGQCRCGRCRRYLDPTVTFQQCPSCSGTPRLRIRRYECRRCGKNIDSHFLFDGRVFNAEYFRRKMAEHRQRLQNERAGPARLSLPNRSASLTPQPPDLTIIPGLLAALDSLTDSPSLAPANFTRPTFSLHRYEDHVRKHIGDEPISLTDIPPATDDARRDRVWCFIAIIFLAHAGLIHVWQEGLTIMVNKRAVNGKRQDIPGAPDAADRIARTVRAIEA
jgi:hypothetical protein